MAKAEDLMGLGLPHFQSRRIGINQASIICGGGSAGSATAINGYIRSVYVTASNAGSGLVLPSVGGDGALLNDQFFVTNMLGAAVNVYAPGTATFLSPDGASVAGTVGVSVSSFKTALFMPITATTWIGMRG